MRNRTGKANDATAAELDRRALLLPHDLVLDVEQKILDLSRSGPRVSFSAFAEVSLRKLLEAPDLAETLVYHGAAARRPSVRRDATK